jgi:hypothetical protein
MKPAKLNRMMVENPRTAAVFTDPRLRRLLLWFVRRPASVAQAATAWDMDPRRAHYYVQRLERLGLLRVVETKARAGRPIKLYRAAGDSFFVPAEAAPRGFGDELIREVRAGLELEFARSEGGMLFTAARNGSPLARIVRPRGDPPRAREFWRVLDLQPGDVEALTRDINALFNRYQRAATGGGQTYLVHAAYALRQASDGVADNARDDSRNGRTD